MLVEKSLVVPFPMRWPNSPIMATIGVSQGCGCSISATSMASSSGGGGVGDLVLSTTWSLHVPLWLFFAAPLPLLGPIFVFLVVFLGSGYFFFVCILKQCNEWYSSRNAIYRDGDRA